MTQKNKDSKPTTYTQENCEGKMDMKHEQQIIKTKTNLKGDIKM